MLLRQLTYLVTLAQEQHFGRAAQKCNVSQPALSGAIRSLEQELGISVVQRSRRFEGFTADGERVLVWARRILSDCGSLRQEVGTRELDPAGVLRFGAIPTTLSMVPLLTDFCLQPYPNMRHEVYTLPASQMLQKISDFELDLGMTYLSDGRLREFQTMPLFKERYVLIARDDSALGGASSLSWEEVARLPLCLLTANMQCRQGIDSAFDAAGVRVVPRVETDSMMVLYAHVRCSGLYSIVPHSALSLIEMRQEITALPIVPELQREIGLVMLRRDPQPLLLASALAIFRTLDLQARVDSFLHC
ncbi:LysR family transcriptional regulator [Pseudomonas gingeri NCPPB 3146 = LMG 5327]|uniref:LysR family transcriptional regulator n=2 Tax=Pseudomonas gingeri TaxID=117681 RepID=A0A7Y7Y276_9PSED|nr:LysR family transcriptional regulator [Pseudomonas gingeri]NVZ26674.1 LysR family transcriptional regulator [Pseudomonas gingeri]NWC16221.1 LysR family transcriptional regulator [Pseudomonas gingeri]NWE71993.1 LysR family transcriptional regulator [Pseudomonas gingeri]PNQ90355.1 LysR family transcriptional regulator [Pseudomonas gingeri NCPPB 3146 = LMG 5327]